MVSWAVELSEHDIQYIPRWNIKFQALADFVAEFSSPVNEETLLESTLYIDGASNIKGSSIMIILIGPEDKLISKALKFDFMTINNHA